MPDPKRIYKWLLNLYPARFREEYGKPLERQFLDEYREARSRWSRAALWARAIVDLSISVPRQTLRELRQDAGYAVRVHRRRPLVTLLAVTALALAIGATTGVFSVVNAVLIRSLPFHDPERLVELQHSPVNALMGDRTEYYRWRDDSQYLQDVAAYSPNEMNLSGAHGANRVKVAETTANFFNTLGAEFDLGRPFLVDEDAPGRTGVAVISYGLWQQAFGSDPGALGSMVYLNGVPLVIVGIAPLGFDYPGQTSVWTPTVFDYQRLPKSGVFFSLTVGRLKAGLPMTQAAAIFQTEVRRLRPESLIENDPFPPRLNPLRDSVAGPVRQASLALLGIVAFVLMIACANVAHLLLSRTNERRHELALRAALGASRARLVQQMITESTFLTLLAAGAGLIIARWASYLTSTEQPAQLSAQSYTILDWRVLGFSIGLALATGIIFGALPANLIGRMQTAEDPMRGQAGAQVSGVGRMRIALVAMQAAFTIILVAGSFTLCRTFLRLTNTDLGFSTDHTVTMNVSLTGTNYDKNNSVNQYFREALDRLRAVPGVQSAAAVQYLPLMENSFAVWGFTPESLDRQQNAIVIDATEDYFRTLGAKVIRGREFTSADRSTSEQVAVVNEAFARETGLGLNIIGKRLASPLSKQPLTVIGVVRTLHSSGPADPGQSQLFRPVEQSAPRFMTFVARVRGKTEGYLSVCRDVLQKVNSEIPVYDVKTLGERLSWSLAKPRFYTTVVLFFGIFAMLLAVIGIYGVASHSIAQRRHEIGVRLAIGASPGQLRRMLLRENLTPVVVGMIAGIIGAVGLGKLVGHLIESADPVGALACAAAAIVLTLTAGGSVWIATRRVMRLDPMTVLRSE